MPGRRRFRSPGSKQAANLGLADGVHFLGYARMSARFTKRSTSSPCPRAAKPPLRAARSHVRPTPPSLQCRGIPEVIVQGETGLLRQLMIIRARSRAQDTARQPLLRQQMGARRQRAIHYFSEREMVARTIELYRRLLIALTQAQQGSQHDLLNQPRRAERRELRDKSAAPDPSDSSNIPRTHLPGLDGLRASPSSW